MALFNFTKGILVREKIQLFKLPKHRRDFTYIYDIVQGAIRLLSKPAQSNHDWEGDSPYRRPSKAPWCASNIGNCQTDGLHRRGGECPR